jgi:F-type H+-transporting ATPase subunit delta
MKDRKLATRYARALLSALPDPARSEAAGSFLSSLGAAMRESPEFRSLMLDPAFPASARKSALLDLARHARQSETTANFLTTLVDNGRCAALPSIAEVFLEERERMLGIVPAELVTASPVSDQQRQRVARALETMTGSSVRLTCSLDSSLLGGAVTRVGSMVYDGSLRTQLNDLRRKMSQE